MVRQATATACPGAEVRSGDPVTPEDDVLIVQLGDAGDPEPAAAGPGLRQSVRLSAGLPRGAVEQLLAAGWQCLQLRRANALLEGNLRTVGRRVAHDLRTPLGSVLTLSQLLQEVVPQSNDEAQNFLGSVLRSAEKLRELIDRMSFFARSAVDPLELGPVPLGEAVQTAQGRVGLQILAKKARLSGPTDWPVVLGNASALETLWRHLLSNALQYTGDTPEIELGWRAEDEGLVRCFVRDRGPGLGVNALTPFEELHGVTAARGLGLATVERLVRQHGGTAAIEKRADGGAEVSFTLRTAES